MTWSERALWDELRKLGANVRRQAPIGPYFADFAVHGRRLVIEVDGGVHERLESVALRDVERQRWLEGEGYTVIRFTDREIEDDVLACAERVRSQLGLPTQAERDAAEARVWRDWAPPTPTGAPDPGALPTPPSPALPPSRRKGE